MKIDRRGFTLVEIMIVVAIIGLLASLAIPSFLKSRQETRRCSCIKNLRLIDHAKEQWATTNSKNNGDPTAATDIQVYLKGNTLPACPAGGTYTLAAVGALPACSLAASPEFHTCN